MAEALSVVGSRAMDRIVRQIVEGFHPQSVILFGSHAYGTPDADSDVDLLVIMDTDDPLHTAGLISASIDHPFPLDIVVLPPSELRQHREERRIFAEKVVAEGKVLYEAGED
ncbi:MAG: nucleotidyltransferase domain-containing protein [Anaerolineae bacterium]|nr:nucleotidyltransferase domain-containing protein [Anaerolineae bacterium]